MIDGDTGKRCNAAQESLTHRHGGATGSHLRAVLDKSILPQDQKDAVDDVFGDFLITLANHPEIQTSAQFFLMEELCKTLFESYSDFNGKFKSLAD